MHRFLYVKATLENNKNKLNQQILTRMVKKKFIGQFIINANVSVQIYFFVDNRRHRHFIADLLHR
jgi:hypothetical protein